MKLQQRVFKLSAILLLLSTLLATVASVPTSVLVQNSELSATNNDIASLNNLKLKNNPIYKVKRSSGTAQDISTSTASAVPANNGLEKKSSPEVVPAVFNSPPARPAQLAQNVDTAAYGLPENSILINKAIAAGLTGAAVDSHEQDFDRAQLYEEEHPASMYKRAAQQQPYSYGTDDGYYSNPFINTALSTAQIPRWADEIDPAANYDLQDLDDYAPIQRVPSYHNKAYDNLQNLLNAEAYLEPVAMPYSNRYYSPVDADRRKRSNPSMYNRYAELRSPKREAKLTPADMLALVALVEAGERAHKDSEPENSPALYAAADSLPPSKNYFGNNIGLYDYPAAALDDDTLDDLNFGNIAAVYEPAAVLDYYGNPVNMELLPKYELPAAREHKFGGRNRLAVKRFMVAKKNRPYGKFLNEPVAKPSISYNTNDENYF